MSRGTLEPPQDESSSERVLKIIETLRGLAQKGETWPESGTQLASDLARFAQLPQTTPSDEDYDMLSIIVDDALSGIDVMKKYPHYYARILSNEELRTAFIETLELLEQSRRGELLEYTGPSTIDLSFLEDVKARPSIRKVLKDKLVITWQRSAEQLQHMFFIGSLPPVEASRSGSYLFDDNYFNILHSQVEVDNQEMEVRLDAMQTAAAPDTLSLMLVVFSSEEFKRRFEVTVNWGGYQQKTEINEFGLAKLPPLNREQVFTESGELLHDLELCLHELN